VWLRHGETEANAQGRYLGHSDSPFTARGGSQMDEAAMRLTAALPGGADSRVMLFTSDLERCVRLAERIGAVMRTVPQRCRALRELDFGRWEGLTYEQIMAADAQHAARWYDDPFAHAPPGGETLHQLGARVDGWIGEQLQSANAADTVIAVSHGGPIRWFLSRHVRGDASAYWLVDGLEPGGRVAAAYDRSGWTIEREEET